MNTFRWLFLVAIFTTISSKNFGQSRSAGIGAISVIELAGVNTWFGTNGHGLEEYNSSTQVYDTFNTANTPWLKNDTITAILYRQFGGTENVFVGTKNGLACYRAGVWDSISHVTGLEITGMLITSGDSLWVTTAGNGIFVFDSTGQNYLGNLNAGNSAIPTNLSTTIERGNTSCSSYTIGTPNQGCFYTPYGVSYSLLDTSAAHRHMVDNRVTSVYMQYDCSAVLIGTKGGYSSCPPGLNCVNLTDTNGLPQNYVTAISEDCYGKIWIGTHDSGVIVYNPRANLISKLENIVDTAQQHAFYLSKSVNGYNYGNDEFDGIHNQGSLFTYNSLTGYSVVYYFDTIVNDFWNPIGNPAVRDTTIWGVTQGGGSMHLGTLYRFNIPSNNLILYGRFDTITGGPPTGIIAADNGFFYGTTATCSTHPYGTLYKYTPPPLSSAIHFQIHFDSLNTGAFPDPNLMQATNGIIYGCAASGGAYGKGTLFQFNPSDSSIKKLYDFQGSPDGAHPSGPVIRTADGLLYGTAQTGGTANYGILFSFDSITGNFIKLHEFDATHATPAYLYLGQNGIFYGLTTGSTGSVFEYNPFSGQFNDLYDFNNTDTLGIGTVPFPNLVMDAEGNLLGRTTLGGTMGLGTLFQFNPKYTGVKTYTTANGLTSNQITAIALDPTSCANNGYIGTGDGNIAIIDSLSNITTLVSSVSKLLPNMEGCYMYPQPASSLCQFVFSHNITLATLSIKDICGQTLKQYTIRNQSLFTADVSSISSGIYFFSVTDGSKMLSSGKISVLK